MYIFTYNNYINCLKHKDELEEIKKKLGEKQGDKLREDSEKYIISNKKLTESNEFINIHINNKHDKIFRKILDNKQEASSFINKALELENKLTPKDIEKYNSSFVTDELRNEESDIIYKIKDRNIFFLIEHQTKIDHTMAFRILEYQIEIIKSAINVKEKDKKGYKFPTVIAIVLYTGKKKWDSKAYFEEVQEKLEGYKGIEIGKYNIVDVNDYTEEELLKDESFLTKAMLIEKAVHSKNLEEYLQKIVEEINSKRDIYTKEQKQLLRAIILLTLGTKIDENAKQELLNKLNEEEGKNMLAVLDMLEKENKKLIRQGRTEGKAEGRLEGIKETAKKMLQKKIDIETVIEVTGLTKKEIIKLSANKD